MKWFVLRQWTAAVTGLDPAAPEAEIPEEDERKREREERVHRAFPNLPKPNFSVTYQRTLCSTLSKTFLLV